MAKKKRATAKLTRSTKSANHLLPPLPPPLLREPPEEERLGAEGAEREGAGAGAERTAGADREGAGALLTVGAGAELTFGAAGAAAGFGAVKKLVIELTALEIALATGETAVNVLSAVLASVDKPELELLLELELTVVFCGFVLVVVVEVVVFCCVVVAGLGVGFCSE